MSYAEEFLRLVLPSKGKYCLAAFYQTLSGPRHTWCDSIEQLVEKADLIDSVALAVYHGCATYGDKTNAKGRTTRSIENVAYLRSLYCEVDVRKKEDKKGDAFYETEDDIIHALDAFLKTCKLPWPIIVHSGGGFHFYWPLTEDVTRDVWQKYATGLKLLASKRGFRVDPGITADSARILRTPGTVNRKYPNAIVQVVDTGTLYTGPYRLADFQILLVQDTKPVPTVLEKTPTDAEMVASKCNQLRRLRDRPQDQTGLEWIAGGRLLSECVHGHKFWNEWSSKDPRYNAVEAEKKWQESVKHGKGITCAYYETINPTGCAGCPFKGKIKSPLILGRTQASNLPEEALSILANAELPRGFKFDKDGQLLFTTEKQNSEGEVEEKVYIVAKFPILITDRSVSEVTKADFSFTLTHWQPKDGWADVHVDAAEFFRNPEVAFASKSIFGADDKLLKRYVKESLNNLAERQKKTMAYESFGWKEEDTKFLRGDQLYSCAIDEDGTPTLHIQKVSLTPTAERLAKHMKPRGTLENACRAGQMLMAPGHEWQAATYLYSYVAPLMNFLIPQEGGVVWSTYDQEGGKGKSLATLAAASVWGTPDGISVTSSDTTNARNTVLSILRHIPLCFDEMNRTDPQAAKEFLQTFTSGQEKRRGTTDGGLQKSERSWRTVMITSSNQELKGALAATEGSLAMGNRVMEVQATTLPMNKKDFKESFKNLFLSNSGQMADAYVSYLVILHAIGKLEEICAEAVEFVESMYDFDPQQRFKVGSFVGFYTVCRILNDSGLISVDARARTLWLLEQNDFNNTFDGLQTTTMEDVLARYMNESVRNTIVMPHAYRGSPGGALATPSDKLTIRRELTGNIYLEETSLLRWLNERQISMKHFKQRLKERRILMDRVRKTLGAGTAFGAGQSWCLWINGKHEDVVDLPDNIIDLDQAKSQRG